MDLKDIKAIIDLMKKNDLSVFEMEKDGFRLKLQKGAGEQTVFSSPAPVAPAPGANGPATTTAAPAPAPEAAASSTLKDIVSPMVGTFYRAGSPDALPFVDVGKEVNEETVVCIIEAMKVMNEIKAETKGVITEVVAESDVVITAAVIPGKKSPVLVTKEMVARMAPGSVIIDLASERGGNCELTTPDETTVVDGVTIIGEFNLAATVPYHASQMYARNVSAFLQLLVKEGKLELNLKDDIIRETMVTRDGEIVNARIREFFSLPALQAEPAGGGA